MNEVKETTRKVSPETVTLLKGLQEHLRRRGLSLTQRELLDEIVEYSVVVEDNLYVFIEADEKDPLKTFLEPSREGPASNCVEEIDAVL